MSSEQNTSLQSANQSDVRVDSFKGRKAIIKRVLHPRVPLLRRVEWWLLAREARILQKLQHLPWIPDFLGYPSDYSFAMGYREGVTLREVDPSGLPPSFFRELTEAVGELHKQGIVHSDLKRKENIMVTPANSPVLIDFGAAFQLKQSFRPLNNWLYRQFKRIDENAVAKYKQRYCPKLLDEEELRGLNEPVFLEKLSRFGRKYILFRE